MNRRDVLRQLTIMLGGSISAPIVTGYLSGCSTDRVGKGWQPKTLTLEQNEIVATVADMIIPETDTPGAKAAGVHEFVDMMLSDWYPEKDKKAFLAGLADMSEFCMQKYSKGFMECTADEQTHILEELEKEYLADGHEETPRSRFFRVMKELTVLGYYTSEIGAVQELRAGAMGQYRGCAPLEEIGKTWAWE